MSVDITSRPYIIGAACEKCVFGSGEHAEWCMGEPKDWWENAKKRPENQKADEMWRAMYGDPPYKWKA